MDWKSSLKNCDHITLNIKSKDDASFNTASGLDIFFFLKEKGVRLFKSDCENLIIFLRSWESTVLFGMVVDFHVYRKDDVRPTFLLTLLLRQTTGHMDIPSVQQQQIQPQSNQRTLTGIVLLSTLFTLVTVALYSSGATYKDHILTIYLTTENTF